MEPVLVTPTPTLAEPAIGEATSVREEPAVPADAEAEPAGHPNGTADGAPEQRSADQEPAPEHAAAANGPAEWPHDHWGHREEPGDAERGYLPQAVPEIDQDAPPFATAPFATVPRLRRVRSTPIPPEDDED
jgi:hypothetical protein